MIVWCVLIVTISGLVGYHFSQKLTKKATFYKNLVNFCEKLELNVTFLQNTIPEILSQEINNSSGETKPFLESVRNYYSRKNQEILLPYYLKENEKNEIVKFIYSVGKTNIESEQKQILAFKQTMKVCQNLAEENKNKNGSLIFKLATFIGLGLAIIIY